MASRMNTKDFFGKGTPNQYDFTLTQYDQALRLKAESKSSKPENVIKLDKWYQNELPKKIKSRGKDAHLVHDELVQTIKWKLARGKFRPNLVNLVQMNTPRVAMQETKKAFRKLVKTGDLQSAAQSLCTLKGVGPGMASGEPLWPENSGIGTPKSNSLSTPSQKQNIWCTNYVFQLHPQQYHLVIRKRVCFCVYVLQQNVNNFCQFFNNSLFH